MTKQKTRQELEEKYWFSQNELLCVGIVALVLFVSFCVVNIQKDELKTQLSGCQEQVPVWTLKVRCEGENSWMEDVQSYDDYEKYEFWKKMKPSYIEHLNPLWRNCEVIE